MSRKTKKAGKMNPLEVREVTKTVFIGAKGREYGSHYDALSSLVEDEIIDFLSTVDMDFDDDSWEVQTAASIVENANTIHQLLDVLIRAKAAKVMGPKHE